MSGFTSQFTLFVSKGKIRFLLIRDIPCLTYNNVDCGKVPVKSSTRGSQYMVGTPLQLASEISRKKQFCGELRMSKSSVHAKEDLKYEYIEEDLLLHEQLLQSPTLISIQTAGRGPTCVVWFSHQLLIVNPPRFAFDTYSKIGRFVLSTWILPNVA